MALRQLARHARAAVAAMLHDTLGAPRDVARALPERPMDNANQTPAEFELATLLVESLNIEDRTPESIDPEAPLFGDGLGLDSIDALELALAISRKYGFQLRSDDGENRRIFSSLRALAAHVEQHRAA